MFVTVGKIQINTNHIISAEYYQSWEVDFDDETGETLDPPRIIPAKLFVYTTQLQHEDVYRGDGSLIGAVARSRRYIFEGEDAEKLRLFLATIPMYAPIGGGNGQ